MNKIETLQDLRNRKTEMKLRLIELEITIREEMREIQEDLKPAKQVIHAIKNIISPDKQNLIGETIGFTVDSLIKNVIFRKSGFLTKTIVALLAKNYTRNLVANKPDLILNWVQSLLVVLKSKHSHNGHFADLSTASTDIEE